MSGLEAFLDDTPGEARGVIARGGRFERLIIHRETDVAAHRLGARSIGRVIDADAGLRGAFVDLGAGEPFGFLPLRKADKVVVGQKIEVEVTAELRDRKGPVLRLIGAGEGEPRLLDAGASIEAWLARLAPGVEVQTGAVAIRASFDAQEEALDATFTAQGLSLSVERTRALIAVDIDHAPTPGRDGYGDKAQANREGLAQAARLIGLKGWGGLVAIDLIGVGHDGAVVAAAARAAFGGEAEAVIGPVNRFGVLMLSLPWRTTPVEELLGDERARAVDAVRRLNLALATDTTSPHLTLRCAPASVARIAPLVARLGPRARVEADATLSPRDIRIDQG